MGQKLANIGTKKSKSDLGYISTYTRYQAQSCDSCLLRGLCHKARENRIIEVNYNLQQYKRKARERLTGEQGIYYTGKRCITRSVFAQIKYNSQFTRFRFRGLEKVNIEFTLVAIAHNLRKMATKAAKTAFYIIFIKIQTSYKKNRLTKI